MSGPRVKSYLWYLMSLWPCGSYWNFWPNFINITYYQIFMLLYISPTSTWFTLLPSLLCPFLIVSHCSSPPCLFRCSLPLLLILSFFVDLNSCYVPLFYIDLWCPVPDLNRDVWVLEWMECELEFPVIIASLLILLPEICRVICGLLGIYPNSLSTNPLMLMAKDI